MSLNSAMRFDRMITTEIVTAIFWVVSVLMIIVGVFILVVGFRNQDATSILTGGIVAVVGPLFLRLWAEAVIVIFRIYETLVEIRDQGGMSRASDVLASPPPSRPRVKKFTVHGRDHDSGFETEVVVNATDQTEAMHKGAAKGVDVDRVEPA